MSTFIKTEAAETAVSSGDDAGTYMTDLLTTTMVGWGLGSVSTGRKCAASTAFGITDVVCGETLVLHTKCSRLHVRSESSSQNTGVGSGKVRLNRPITAFAWDGTEWNGMEKRGGGQGAAAG